LPATHRRARAIAIGRTLLLVTTAVLAVQLVLAGWVVLTVGADARVPIHWGIDGTPDGFADAWLAVAIAPAITLVLGPLLAFLPQIDPRRANLMQSSTAYVWICGTLLVLLAGVQLLIALAARDASIATVPLLGLGAGAMLVVIGSFLGRTRSNWFMGIRTPWTLSSERSWELTHRVGGYLFMAVGAVTTLCALLLPAEVYFWTLMIGLAGSVAFVVAYSYVVWRDDPDRQTM
jgi:uncharacterized membrane protein